VSADFEMDLSRRLEALDETTASVDLRDASAIRRRGRQRARRQTAAAVVSTLAVVGIGVAAVTGLAGRAAEPLPVGPVPSVTVEPTPDGVTSAPAPSDVNSDRLPVGPVPSVTVEPTPDGVTSAPAPSDVDPDPARAWLEESDLPTEPYGAWTAEDEGGFVWDQAPPSPTWDYFPCAPTGDGMDVEVPVEADTVGAAARRFSVDGHQLTQYVLEYPDVDTAGQAWDRHAGGAGPPCEAVLLERATSDVRGVEVSSTPFADVAAPVASRSVTAAARFFYPAGLSEEGFVVMQEGRLVVFVTVRPVGAPLDIPFAGTVFSGAGDRLRAATGAP